MRRLLVAVVLFAVGCEYGPEHLDALYWQRDAYLAWVERYQGYIDQVETKYHIPSRDREHLARDEAARKAQEEADRAFRDWFATLTPDQRFQWLLVQQLGGSHRDWMRTEMARILLAPQPATGSKDAPAAASEETQTGN